MEEVCGPQCEFVEDEAAEAANETAHKEVSDLMLDTGIPHS